ncbi:MAG: SDR family NAD(P)-dependent oxidoreductase [Chloroflexi bacterium]|nr:MAG: SDR family NAD(P)-dependent oxidoreductase [Chloroflexota bacterium]
MKSIIITGSTRGIGLGLADAFLAKGCAVTVNGRSQTSVDQAIADLSQSHDANRIAGQAASVSVEQQVEKVWETAVSRFGKVDIWINNAGLNHNLTPPWQVPIDHIQSIVETNLTGLIVCSHIVVRKMQDQGYGQLYSMYGAGSKGHIREGMSIYGTTKAGVKAFTDALIAETKEMPIQVGSISPGMVVTDMLMNPLHADPTKEADAKRIFNILADKTETVTPWLAEKILDNKQHGAEIKWLTTPKIIWRFATASIKKRDLFTND